MARDELCSSEARRIALAAQGFDRPRPTGPVGIHHLRRTIRQLSLVQIDYVNVLLPAHYQVLYSRLGPYDRSRLHHLIYRRREFTEQWAHEASIVPVDAWPLLRHRMAVHRVRPWGFEKFLQQYPEYVGGVLGEVRTRGPLTADELGEPDGVGHWLAQSWHKSIPRAVLEAHFGRGVLAVADRRADFARVYDLAERVVPPEHHGREMATEEAQRELLRRAARACGVGTAGDLADYYRMYVREAQPRLEELVSAGELSPVRVEGWREPAFLHRDARLPRAIDGSALLSPFDPVVWFRPRTARLFGFDFRFEIFVPPEKRKWGCYVLPFLLGDRLVARVDLKADRGARRLLVLAAYAEAGVDKGTVAKALVEELGTMARWLELDGVQVGSRGDLAPSLRRAVRLR
jgi:uncharacterized protein YcaQ